MLTRVGRKLLVKLTDLGLAIAKGEDEFRLTRGVAVRRADWTAAAGAALLRDPNGFPDFFP